MFFYLCKYKFICLQAWDVIIKETETTIKTIRENADNLCAQTLEKLVQLINEKKAARRNYAEERNRHESDFSKVMDLTIEIKTKLQ